MKKITIYSFAIMLILGAMAVAASVPQRYRTVEPEKIGWKESRRFPVGLETPKAIAVDAKGDLYLAGKRSILVLDHEGKPLRTIELEFEPNCLTVDPKGTLFAASRDHVWKVAGKEGEENVSSEPIKNAVLTGIVTTEKNCFVTDAGNRTVWRFSRPFAGEKPERFTAEPFIVPSPYFDLAVGHDGLLRIADPGRHRIRHFTEEGYHESPLDWGRQGFELDEFPTCCNPAHVAILSDDALVTVEKKIPRVKVYELDGKLRSVVVDPKGLIGDRNFDTFASRLVVDVAVGPNDEIYLLDPIAKEVRQFERVK